MPEEGGEEVRIYVRWEISEFGGDKMFVMTLERVDKTPLNESIVAMEKEFARHILASR